MQERKAPERHPQHGVEGRAPHWAEAFVAMRKSEDRSLAVTTLHTTRHGNRAVARYNQIPGRRDQQKTDWTRKPQGTNRGAGRTRGGDGGWRKRANPKQSQTTQEKTHRTTEGDTNNTLQRPRHTRNTTGQPRENAQTKSQPTHQAQAEQADKQSRPINTGPNTQPGDKRKKKTEYTQRTEGQPDNRRKVAKSQTKKGGVKQASRRKQKRGRRVSTSYSSNRTWDAQREKGMS